MKVEILAETNFSPTVDKPFQDVKVFIDGKEMERVVNVSFDLSVGSVPSFTMTVYPDVIKVNELEIDTHSLVPDFELDELRLKALKYDELVAEVPQGEVS